MHKNKPTHSFSKSYDVSKHFLLIQDEFFIESSWLTHMYKVPNKTILNGIHQQRLGKSKSWASVKNKHTYFICYSTIPSATIKKYKISSPELIMKEAEVKTGLDLKDENVKKISERELYLQAFINNHRKYLRHYDAFDLPIEAKTKLAKSHAALDMILQYDNLSLKEKYDMYNQVYDETFSFKASNYAYFTQKLREIKDVGMENALVKRYFGNTNALKVSKLVTHAIMKLYKESVKFSLNHITNDVNTFLIARNYETVSRTTVDTTIRKNQRLCNILSYTRNGERWAKERLFPKLVRLNAAYPGDLYLMDGSRLQVAYKGPNNKPSFLDYVVIMDACSHRILAVEYDEVENVQMYERALRRVVGNYQFLPAEILSDNLKQFFKPGTGFADLMDNMVSLGVHWRKHRPTNARDKGLVEGFFFRFQHNYCKTLEGYVGEGIKSNNADAHPSPEFIAKSVKGNNLRTKQQLIDRVNILIANYNNDVVKNGYSEKDSPGYIFNDLDKPHVILLSENQVPVFKYRKIDKKVYNSSICIQRNKSPHYYRINDIEMAMSLNNSVVEVRYCESDPCIYCYQIPTGKFLCRLKEAEPVNMAKANQTETDQKAIHAFYQHEKEMFQYVRNELSLFEEETKNIDDGLVLLNPVSYTKDEVKKAEDSSISLLQDQDTRPDKKPVGSSKIKRKIKVVEIGQGRDLTTMPVRDIFNDLLFKNKSNSDET